MKHTLTCIVFLFTLNIQANAESDDSCREAILKSTCLVEKDYEYNPEINYFDNLKAKHEQKCLEGTEPFAKELYDLFPTLPAHTQKAFCFIKKIFIVPGETPYGGRATMAYDWENPQFKKDEIQGEMIGYQPIGFTMELSKEGRFDVRETSVEYQNRILQYFFGINTKKGDKPAEFLPEFTFVGEKQYSSLYYTLVHEIGHFFDFTSDVSFNPVFNSPEGVPEQTDWFNMSWNYVEVETEEYTYFQSIPIVPAELIAQEGVYDINNWQDVVYELGQSPFSTFYSLSWPLEDFAEHYSQTLLNGHFELAKGNDFYFGNDDRASNIYDDKTQFMKTLFQKDFSDVLKKPVTWISLEVPQVPPPQHAECKLLK